MQTTTQKFFNLSVALTLCAIQLGCRNKSSENELNMAVHKVSAVEANLFIKDGQLKSDMGPTYHIACKDPMLMQRNAPQGYFYIAPSDALLNAWFGKGECAKNRHGGEPDCEQYQFTCGAVVKLTPMIGAGTTNLMERVLNGTVINAMGFSDRAGLYKQLAEQTKPYSGASPYKVPSAVYAVINDFCPKNHSINASSGQCSGVQIDLGPGPWFSMMPSSLINPQNYVLPDNFKVKIDLVEEGGKLTYLKNNPGILGNK